MKLQKKYFLYLRFFEQKSKRYQVCVCVNIGQLHIAFYVPGAMSFSVCLALLSGKAFLPLPQLLSCLPFAYAAQSGKAPVSPVNVAIPDFRGVTLSE